MAEDDLIARLRAEGVAGFRRSMQGAAKDVRSVGSAASTSNRVGSRAMRDLASNTRGVAVNAKSVAAGYAAWKVGDALRDAVSAGVMFNRTQDRQRVGFETLLGSAGKARDMMGAIQDLAFKSPILNVAQTGQAVQTLLAYGIAQKDVIGDAERLANTAGATGKSLQEALPLGARAMGQIAGKGKLQMEELNQLAEGVGLSAKDIREELGMTKDEWAKAFTPGNNISAEKALPAIRRVMDRYSGASEKLAKTTEGQFAAAQDRLAKGMGALTRPAYDEAGRVIGRLSKDLFALGDRKDLTIGEKLSIGSGMVREEARGVMDKIKATWREENLGPVVSDAVEGGLTWGMNAAADAAPKVAGAFVKAWWASGTWTKLLTAGFLLSKMGAFRAVGGVVAGRFASGFGSRAGTAIPEQLSLFGEGGKKAGKLSAIGRSMGRVMGPAMALTMAPLIIEEIKALAADPAGFTDHDPARIDALKKRGSLPAIREHLSQFPEDQAALQPRIDQLTKPTLPQRAGQIRRGERPGAGGTSVLPAPQSGGAGGLTRTPNVPRAHGSSTGYMAAPHLAVEVPVKIGEREFGRASARVATKDLVRP